jgi:hypothetical protein
MQHSVPQVVQAAGRQGAVLLARHSGEVSDDANANSRVHEEGIVERRRRSTLFTRVLLKRWERAGCLERLVRLRGRASPRPRVGLAPLPHPFHMGRTAEGVVVFGCAPPTTLTGRCAGLSTWRRRTGVLAPNMARVRIKACRTVLTRARAGWTDHWPASPQVNDRHIAAWTEANGEEKAGDKQAEEERRHERNGLCWKKTDRGYPPFSTCAFDSSFRSPLTEGGLWPKNGVFRHPNTCSCI